MSTGKKAKKIQESIFFDPDIHPKVAALAKFHRQTLSQAVNFICDRYFETVGKPPPGKAKN